MGQTTIFLTDSEQWTLETINWPGTMEQCMWNVLDITFWIGAHWSWFGKIHPWSHPLAFPSQGTRDNFRRAQTICFRHPWMQLSCRHQGELCETQSSSSSDFWDPSVRDSFEVCQWQLSRTVGICGCHHFARPTWWDFTCHGATPCGEQVLFLLPQLLHHLFLHPPPLY